jgi:hypothetical protein
MFRPVRAILTKKPEHLLKIFTLDLREIWILLLASHGFTSKTPFVLCTIFAAVNAGFVMDRGLLIVMVESVTAPCLRVAVTVLEEGCVCLLVTLKVARNGNLFCIEVALSLDVGTKLRRGCTLLKMQNPTLLVPGSQYFAFFSSNKFDVSFPRATHES